MPSIAPPSPPSIVHASPHTQRGSSLARLALRSTPAPPLADARPLLLEGDAIERGESRRAFAVPADALRDAALARARRAPKVNPHRAHHERTRRQLARMGVRPEAPGARVFVVSEDTELSTHGANIVRVIGGPIGLAQGANIEWLPPVAEDRSTPPPLASTLEDGVTWSAGEIVNVVRETAEELASLADRLDTEAGEHGVSVATLSLGLDPLRAAHIYLRCLAATTPESATFLRLDAEPSPPDAGPASTARDAQALRFAERIHQRLSKGPLEASLAEARADLGRVVSRLERRGVMVLASAGNSHQEGAPARLSASPLREVDGLVLVGAADLGHGGHTATAKPAFFSARTATVFAPGVDLPIAEGERFPGLDSGTSYSAPWAASALALASRQSPALTVAEIRALLVDTATTPLARAGMDRIRVVDPVALIEAIRAR